MNDDAYNIDGFDANKFLASVSEFAGVYQMMSSDRQLLYVGKAKNLKRRLSSYFNNKGLSTKTIHLVSNISEIVISVTENEAQALILEQDLIKQFKPPYNVIFKDDKSYPYIFLSDHKHPRLAYHRGTKKKKGQYFGPFPSAKAVKESLDFLQKVFKVRQCEDSYYANRSRPCLQYQIKRCLAPCYFDHVDDKYKEAEKYTRKFLMGSSSDVIKALADDMEEKAAALNFEAAGEVRDQIQHLQYVQSKHGFNPNQGNCDVLAIVEASGKYCVHCMFIRDGRVLGSQAYYPKVKTHLDIESIFEDFIGQRYVDGVSVPGEIICNYDVDEGGVLAQALSTVHKKSIKIRSNVRGQRAKWLKLCEGNAHENLKLSLAMGKDLKNRLKSLQEVLNLSELPEWMECFDISHHSGKETMASCVVFSQKGPEKKRYRTFSIKDITPGDDYAAMRQVLKRRYQRLIKDAQGLPNIVFVDGGKGQLSAAKDVFNELNLQDVLLVGVSKGPTRKAGFELLHFVDGREVQLDVRSKALHLIQHMRDESHRFAVRAHTKAKKASQRSSLEDIPGIGPVKRKELLRHFGGLQQIKLASIDELMAVDGINSKTAELIYVKLNA